jgi:hypothetical protein
MKANSGFAVLRYDGSVTVRSGPTRDWQADVADLHINHTNLLAACLAKTD